MPPPQQDIRDLIQREIDRAEYEEIRALWKRHSIAEDERDLSGLMATLTPDCLYEVFPGGHTWRGHEGATRFYTHLLSAIPDVHFDLRNIVIGPQGVFEEARVTGTHREQWLDFPPSGGPVDFTVTIYFPWDAELRLFRGERVHYHGVEMRRTPDRS